LSFVALAVACSFSSKLELLVFMRLDLLPWNLCSDKPDFPKLKFKITKNFEKAPPPKYRCFSGMSNRSFGINLFNFLFSGKSFTSFHHRPSWTHRSRRQMRMKLKLLFYFFLNKFIFQIMYFVLRIFWFDLINIRVTLVN
jgi:hypothetical protein